jgi:hypothetical protein
VSSEGMVSNDMLDFLLEFFEGENSRGGGRTRGWRGSRESAREGHGGFLGPWSSARRGWVCGLLGLSRGPGSRAPCECPLAIALLPVCDPHTRPPTSHPLAHSELADNDFFVTGESYAVSHRPPGYTPKPPVPQTSPHPPAPSCRASEDCLRRCAQFPAYP